MQIAVKILSPLCKELPAYASPDASGMDVRACLEKPICIEARERVLVPTGIAVAIPSGYEIQVRPRSGLALRHGITLLNTPGTIDADYRGEVGVILINMGPEPFILNPFERIAQLILQRVETIEWQVSGELPTTLRGEGGFGSTGNDRFVERRIDNGTSDC